MEQPPEKYSRFFRPGPLTEGLTETLTKLYAHAHSHKLAGDPPKGSNYRAWQGSLQQVVEDLRSGKLQPQDLNADLFNYYKGAMLKGAGSGFKASFDRVDYNTPDYALLNKMRANLYTFSGAKTYAHLKEINGLMYDDQGKLRDFREFRDRASAFYQSVGVTESKYQNWLGIEHDTAIAQGQHARQWQTFMDNIDIFPNLRYRTMEDDKVRAEHEALNNLVLAKDDPYVDSIIPIKVWGCRCDMEETDDPISENRPQMEFDGPFKGNVGKDGIIISDRHPYFPQASKMRDAIQSRVDEFARQEYVEASRNIYEQYNNDDLYRQLGFDEQSGGFIIRHSNAQNYTAEEDYVFNLLKTKGERLVLPEISQAPYNKNFDVFIDQVKFEQKTITGNIKQRVEENLRDAADQASNAILYFPDKFSLQELKRGLGNIKDKSRLNTIMIVRNEKVAVITRREIIAKDFSALEKWK